MPPKDEYDPKTIRDLLRDIEAFPVSRKVTCCGKDIRVSPFDFYATCTKCGNRFKLRSFGAVTDIEDIFDAFLLWLGKPGANEVAIKRQAELAEPE